MIESNKRLLFYNQRFIRNHNFLPLLSPSPKAPRSSTAEHKTKKFNNSAPDFIVIQFLALIWMDWLNVVVFRCKLSQCAGFYSTHTRTGTKSAWYILLTLERYYNLKWKVRWLLRYVRKSRKNDVKPVQGWGHSNVWTEHTEIFEQRKAELQKFKNIYR